MTLRITNGVALAEVGDHAFLERVEFAAERVGLFGGKSDRVFGHRPYSFRYRASSMSPTGTDTQICTSSSSVVEIDPVMRLRTAPRVLRRVQLWQMPIRHPLSGLRLAASACSSSGRPSSVTSIPVSVKAIRPPDDSVGTVKIGGTKLSG